MPVQTAAIPLPFDDAVIVIEGRIADARLQVENAQEAGDRRRTRTWVLRTGLWSPLGGGVEIPALPAIVVVRLAESGPASCVVTLVNDGAPAVAILDFLVIDLGSGRRGNGVLRPSVPNWTAAG
jgi:hypothetical protein